jgi:hypothetical protein
MEVTPADGFLRSDTGALTITDINTRGDEAGWLVLAANSARMWAEVQDIDSDVTGAVEGGTPMGARRGTRAPLVEEIAIAGLSRRASATTFEPRSSRTALGLQHGDPVQATRRVLRLKDGKKWRAEPGFIIAKAVKVGAWLA